MSFLAIVFFGALHTVPPAMLGFYASHEACLVDARRINHEKRAELDSKAARVLCLKADIGDA